MTSEIYFSVDIETAGPNPGDYAMLSIGACVATDVSRTFYVELKPDKLEFDTGSLEIHGLSLDTLTRQGEHPVHGLEMFEDWVLWETPQDARPIFVAFNAPFDWMFVNDYFLRYLKRNPFGHNALDMKALYMGLNRVTWSQTSMGKMMSKFPNNGPLTHHALQDAIDQALIFQAMLKGINLENNP